jgi:hypothetical protein
VVGPVGGDRCCMRQHAHVQRDLFAQPAMHWIGISSQRPEQWNPDLWKGDRKGKPIHSITGFSGLPFGNTGDQTEYLSEAKAIAKP